MSDLEKPTIKQFGHHNTAFGEVSGGQFIFYQNTIKLDELEEKIETLNLLIENLNLQPAHAVEKRQQLQSRIQTVQQQITEYKDSYNKIGLQLKKFGITSNSVSGEDKTLESVQQLFSQGKIKEARNFLENNVDKINQVHNELINEKERYEKEVLPNLIKTSNQFLMLALFSGTEVENPKRFENALHYFKLSMQSYETKDNTFQYGSYLLLLGEFDEAEKILLLNFEKFSPEFDEYDRINININLGLLFVTTNKLEKAKTFLMTAFELLQTESAKNSEFYQESLGAVNLNLGILNQRNQNLAEAKKHYLTALEIYRQLAQKDPLKYQSNLINTLNNLGNISMFIEQTFDVPLNYFLEAEKLLNDFSNNYQQILLSESLDHLTNYSLLLIAMENFEKVIEKIEKGLEIIKTYGTNNSKFFLPKKAMLLTSLTIAYIHQNNFEEAEKHASESLEILSELVNLDFEPHYPRYLIARSNLAFCWQKLNKNKEESIEMSFDTIAKMILLIPSLPEMQSFLINPVNILKNWGFSEDEINRLSDERVRQYQSSISPL